jgi:hypothetical protein
MEDNTYHITPDGIGDFSVQVTYGDGRGIAVRHGFKSDTEACEWIRAQGDENPRIVRK